MTRSKLIPLVVVLASAIAATAYAAVNAVRISQQAGETCVVSNGLPDHATEGNIAHMTASSARNPLPAPCKELIPRCRTSSFRR